MLKQERQYFDRHLKLKDFGETAQNKLFNAKVLVVGAGGLGCPLLQYLVTAGVKTVGIVDGDTVSPSNLHRQILYNMQDVGLPKAQVASKKLTSLQPLVHIETYNFYLNSQNILEIFNKYDIVVDGTDNFATRFLINDACVITGKPLVSGAISDYVGQLSVFNYKGGPTYRCLFPEEPSDDDCTTCSINGVLNVLPGLIALYMANEVIKIITNYGEILSGKLLLIDIQSNHHQMIYIDAIPEHQTITKLPLLKTEVTLAQNNRHEKVAKNENGQTNKILLTVREVQEYLEKNPKTRLIDVREQWEFDEYNIGGQNIPLFDLIAKKEEIHSANAMILLCQTGKRSLYAAHILKKNVKNILVAQLNDSELP
jgi:adenylyltransferase/sulfurtransferase